MDNPPRPPGNTPRTRSDQIGVKTDPSSPYTWNGRFPRMGLAADAQLQKNRFVALWARISQVSQKPATLGNQGQQPFAGAMILLVRLEMLRKHRDAGAQQGNLYFWRPGIGFVALIPGENLLICFNRQCHSRGNAPCLLLISLWYVHQNTTARNSVEWVDEGRTASELPVYRVLGEPEMPVERILAQEYSNPSRDRQGAWANRMAGNRSLTVAARICPANRRTEGGS